MNLIPPILFAFSISMGLTLTQQSIIAFSMLVGGALFQPIVGHLLDKIGKSVYLIIGIVWISFLMSITGLITNYYLLIIIVGLASIASSIYHPLGSSIAINLSKESRGKSLSAFLTIGVFSSTFAPMIGIPIVTKYGLKYLAFLMIPGFLVAYFLKYAKIDKIKCRVTDDKKNEKIKKDKISKNKVKYLLLLVCMSVIRAFFLKIMIVFGVQIMIMKGIGIIPAGIILSVHLFLSSVGILSGGYLSDKFGERRIMVIFSILLFGIYTIIIFSHGLLVIIGIIFFGYVLHGSSTANITMVHNILPDNINLGTGIIMGLSNTIAGVLMLVFGKFADIYGLMEMAQVITCLSLIPIFISLYISKKYDLAIVKPALAR
ncbi:MAG: MFS transporter [Candidatus Atribacteria bacterium]|nr:MFS transporter [Candidatus Atribacteria bacterium]